MQITSQNFPAAPITLLGAAHLIIHRITAATAQRRELRRARAEAAALQQMDPRLLSDMGVASTSNPLPLEHIGKFNPTFLAATVFCLPHNGR